MWNWYVWHKIEVSSAQIREWNRHAQDCSYCWRQINLQETQMFINKIGIVNVFILLSYEIFSLFVKNTGIIFERRWHFFHFEFFDGFLN